MSQQPKKKAYDTFKWNECSFILIYMSWTVVNLYCSETHATNLQVILICKQKKIQYLVGGYYYYF